MRRSLVAKGFVAAIGLLHAGGAALAQDTQAVPAAPLTIELNKVTDAGTGCRLTFLASNKTGVNLTKVTYEMAFLDSDGQVAGLRVLAFNGMSKNKTKVFEFPYTDLPCARLSRILVNAAPDCLADKAPSPVCLDALVPSVSKSVTIAFTQ